MKGFKWYSKASIHAIDNFHSMDEYYNKNTLNFSVLPKQKVCYSMNFCESKYLVFKVISNYSVTIPKSSMSEYQEHS